jgi:Flp pilus assembly protein TadG
MPRTKLALAVSAAALLLAACSSSSTSSTPPTSTAAAAPAATSSAPAASAAPAPAAGLTGKWSGQYSGAYQGTFVLHWTQSGSKLKGHITLSTPPDTLPILGTVNGSVIRFGTVGSTGITYSGSVSNSTMSGTYQVHAPQGAIGGPWKASKTS